MSIEHTLYTDKFLDDLKISMPSFKDFYEDITEGRVGFEFDKHSIELSTDYAEKADPEFLALLLKTFSKSDDDFNLPVTTETKAIVHTWATGMDGSQASTPEIRQEQNSAQRALDRAHMLTSQHTEVEAAYLPISKLKAQYLQAVMNTFDTKEMTPPDKQEVNKQGETVFIKDIMHEGKVAGGIKYLETDSQVTILRSDVERTLRGRGIGTEAYKRFVDEKLSEGKTINSDNIVSLDAQRLYKQLDSQGYTVNKQPSRMKYRQDQTTLLPDNARAQMHSFPVVYVDGAGVSESGYRMKGSPVYTVTKSPNVALDMTPIEIAIVDNKTGHEKTFRVSPNKVTLSEKQSQPLSLSNPALFKELSDTMEEARNALIHKGNENTPIKERLTTDNIHVWKVQTVERESLKLALTLNHERNLSAEKSYI